MTWITTNTISGPLTTDNYNYTITGLSASTKYQYRAYFIVDGVEYYGNILTGTTAANPTVTTGNVSGLTTISGFNVYNNIITNIGGTPIIEHGILYTQQAIYGNSAGLVYTNFPNVCKASSFSGVTITPYMYSANTNNLIPDTLTYYRAFARNAKGVGYGTIKTQHAMLPVNNIDINVNISWNENNSDLYDGIGGTLSLRCCNNLVVETHNISNYSKNVVVEWNVSAGCYYVDFSGLEARNDDNLILWDLSWYDGNVYGNSMNSNCYNTSTFITATMPNLSPMLV